MHSFAVRLHLTLLLSAAATLPAVSAQDKQEKQDKPVAPLRSRTAAMTNADVMSLTAAGIDADIIVSKIRSAPSTAFDTSVDSLKALKAAGVANDVILNMVTEGTAPNPGSDDAAWTTNGSVDFKEPVLKEGLWEEQTSTTMRPGDPPSTDTRSACHTHAYDHAEFQKLRNMGGGGEPGTTCRITGSAVEDGKQMIETQCRGHGRTMSMKMSWTVVDEDHLRGETAMVYSLPVQGMSKFGTVSEMTFKGPCPAGVAPGGTVDDEARAYQKKSKKGH